MTTVLPNEAGRANRRPAFPFNAEQQIGSASCAPPCASAAVAHFWRWAAMRFLLLFLMLAFTGCSGPQKPGVSPNRSHAAIAKEIVSIQNTFGNALLQLNNTNVAIFAAEAESCSSRLERISKELDALGPFPSHLRETTRKAMDDADKVHARIAQMASTPSPLQPEADKALEKAGDRFFSAWGEVQRKAGLDINAVDSKGLRTNRLPLGR